MGGLAMSKTKIRLAALLLMSIAALAFATDAAAFIIYKVGAAPDCPFHTIQEAVDAAAANPGTDLVWIAMDQEYTGQHVVVADQNVIIEGGFTDCFDDDPGVEQTVINGTNGHSVFEIEGTGDVFLGNLLITGAVMDESHSGGGIYFGGQGSLTLHTVWVFQNQAGYGGGIDVSPTGPTLVTLTGSVVSSNTALVSGGGIRIEGFTELHVVHTLADEFDYITHNTALGQGEVGYGGGIEVLGPAYAGFAGVLADNSAPYGAGIAAIATDQGAASVGVYTSNPASPGAIYDNVASRTGGGIFLKSYGAFGYQTTLCASSFDIHANTAINGAAIYADLDGDTGAKVEINPIDPRVFCGAESVQCAAGTRCNDIDDNVATDGSIVLMQSNGVLWGNRFSMRGNHAHSAIAELTDAPTYATLSNCLLAANSLTGPLIDAYTPGDLDVGSALLVDSCTFAGNALGAADVIHGQVADFSLTDSIVDQLGRGTVDGLVFPPWVHYVLSNDIGTLPASDDVVQGSPTFVDEIDYRLQPTSLGVDFAPLPEPYPPRFDLDGFPRDVDLAAVQNGWGSMDLGAYEIQDGGVVDPIFAGSFD